MSGRQIVTIYRMGFLSRDGDTYYVVRNTLFSDTVRANDAVEIGRVPLTETFRDFSKNMVKDTFTREELAEYLKGERSRNEDAAGILLYDGIISELYEKKLKMPSQTNPPVTQGSREKAGEDKQPPITA